VQEPRRLARRYLIEGLPFAITLFCGSLFQRLRDPACQAHDESTDALAESLDGS
jgi:hypothetical protein